jgi:hypothetical protein
MDSLNQSRWQRAIRFALGDTAAQRCVQFALLVPAGLWLRLRNMHAPWEGVLGKHIREGKPLDFDEKIKVQLWQAADLCCALLFLLVILSPWWLRWIRRDPKPDVVVRPAAGKGFPRWTVLWLLLLMGIAFAVRWPLYERTILRDEQDSVRRNIIGYLIEDAPGKQEPVLLDWKTTIWEDAQANNPFLFSILARSTLRVWQAATDAKPWQVNLQVLRLWALIPGLLSLAAIWWSLRLMGHPRAAWIALAVGAIHPMHADYSTQARGYALVMLFSSLSPGLAWLALADGRWRYWIGLAACFFGMLYANPASAYFVAALGGALALCLGWRAFVGKDARSRCDFARLGICGAMAFLVFVPLIWPALPQAAGYLKKEMQGSIGGVWPVSTWSRYSSGVMMPDAELGRQWLNFDPDEPSELMLRRRAIDFLQEHYVPEEPLLFVTVFLIIPALMVAGAYRFFRQHPAMWPVLAGSIAAPFLGYALHHWVLYTFIYYWYLIYAMPVVLMLFGLGLEAAGEMCLSRVRRGWVFWSPAAGFLVLLVWVNQAGLGRLGWTQPPFTHPEIFDRGRFLWITHPDGQTVRVPDPNGK